MSRLKDLLRLAFDFKFHLQHQRMANRVLSGLEKKYGKTPEPDIKRAREYAVEVLGHRKFAPWLYVYSAVAGCFKEGWIPDNFYGCTVVPKRKGIYGRLSSLKSLNQFLLNSDYFPDLISQVNGVLFDRHGVVVPADNVQRFLFESGNKVVFKADDSWQGAGISFFTNENLDVAAIPRLGNGVFQIHLQQHELFDKFSARSVAALRMTTVVEPAGHVSLRSSYLRVAGGSETHVQSATHVRIPVSIQSGVLADFGYLANWHRIDHHPTTKTPFASLKIPAFDKCVSAVKDLHQRIPFVQCIGWDLIVDKDENVKVMEWNGEHNDIKFSEATQGPCFLGLGWEKLKPGHVPWDDRD